MFLLLMNRLTLFLDVASELEARLIAYAIEQKPSEWLKVKLNRPFWARKGRQHSIRG